MSRISYLTRFEHPKRILLNNTSDLQETMRKISTGKKLSNPSDNPPDLVRSFSFHNQKEQIQQYDQNITAGKNKLSASESIMSEVTGLVQRVRELAVRGANDSLGAKDRDLIASEVDQRLEELFDVANSQQADKYLFGGAETQGIDQLFSAERNGEGEIVDVNYHGDATIQKKQVGEGEKVVSNLLGHEVFQATNQGVIGGVRFDSAGDVTTSMDSATTPGGNIGKNEGYFKIDGEKFYYDTGSDTLEDLASRINNRGIPVEAVIQGNEQITNTGSEADNTFRIDGNHKDKLSADDKFTVKGAGAGGDNDGAYTVDSVSEDGGDTFIKVKENVVDDPSAAGGRIEGIADYKPGSVSGTGHDSYQLKLKSRTPHKISLEDVDRNPSASGVQGLLNDLQMVSGDVNEDQNFPNSLHSNSVIEGKSLFDTIIDLREALQEGVGDADEGLINQNNAQTTRNLDPANPREQIEQALEDLKRGTDNILTHRSVGGARLNRLESAKNRLDDKEVNTIELISEIEDTNLAKVISDYKRQQSVQQASLRMAGKVMQMTLANYI